jgi:dTDP-4-dehydrorhamnose reductase
MGDILHARQIVIMSANGQLAHDLRKVQAEQFPSDKIIGSAHVEIEVPEIDSVRAALERIRPDFVLNTSAYHKVDIVEDNPHRAFMLSSTGFTRPTAADSTASWTNRVLVTPRA